MKDRAAGARQAEDDAGDFDFLGKDFRMLLDVIDHAQSADQAFDNDLGLACEPGGCQPRFCIGRPEIAIHRLEEPEIAEV